MPAKILVVDDEPQLERLILQRFRRKVKNQEYEFFFAQDGVEALEMVTKEGNFDIVLSDINMPKMDGLEFIAQLQKVRLLLKTIMVSAYGDMKNIRTAMNRGAYDFVTKPIDFGDLNATLDKALKEVELLKIAVQNRNELTKMHQELNVASEIQQSIIPKNFKVFPPESKFEMSARMIPAKEIGGDFYDFFKIDNDRLGVVIADVSGKGIPGALFMAISRTLFKATALKGDSPGECMNQVNYLLSQDNPKSMFVTMFYGIINILSGKFEYCNAGHNVPCIAASDGQVKFMERSNNIALGVEEDFDYKSNIIQLRPDNFLVLYTDGIPEAVNKELKEFSNEQLREYLTKCSKSSPENIIEGLIKEVNVYADGMQQSDDITVLVVKHNR
jgi:sigma-B regulation protein RsbU (phosphoserine phosphatase)